MGIHCQVTINRLYLIMSSITTRIKQLKWVVELIISQYVHLPCSCLTTFYLELYFCTHLIHWIKNLWLMILLFTDYSNIHFICYGSWTFIQIFLDCPLSLNSMCIVAYLNLFCCSMEILKPFFMSIFIISKELLHIGSWFRWGLVRKNHFRVFWFRYSRMVPGC